MRQVHMSEDVTTNVGVRGVVRASILHEVVEPVGRNLLRAVRLTRLAAPPRAKAQGDIGVYKPAEEPACHARTEKTIHQAKQRLPLDIHIIAVGEV